MFKVNLFTLLTLTIVIAVNANSCAVKEYKEKLLPACDIQDIQIKWPNYEDQTMYYRCVGLNSARLLSCPSGKVFVYVYQECRGCEDYIPAVECRNLRTQNTPICVPINNGVVTYPTPRYPTTTSDVSTISTSETSVQPDDDSSTTEVPITLSTDSTGIPQPSSPPPTPESTSGQPDDITSTVEVSSSSDDVKSTPFPTPPSIG